ncbi:MAG: PspA/IM30 family protein [Chitinispirillaceae bacterium]
MKENLASRVGRIITGGANKVVSMIEHAAPEIVLEEALREIDSAVYDVRSELGKVIAQKHMANTRLVELNKNHDDLDEKITFALKENREDLAEAAVSKQLDLEAQIPVVEKSVVEYDKQQKELENYAAALVAKKRELSQEFQEFKKVRAESAKDSSAAVSQSNSALDDRLNRAEETFGRVLDRAQMTTSAANEKQLAELEDLARKNRISERLAQYKARS